MAIQKEQGLTDVKITKHSMGDSPEPQQRQWKLLDGKSQNLIDRDQDFIILDFFKISLIIKVYNTL